MSPSPEAYGDQPSASSSGTRSTHSTVGRPFWLCWSRNSRTPSAAPLTVRTLTGRQSPRTAASRSEWPGRSGLNSGTAMAPAYRQPRKATT